MPGLIILLNYNGRKNEIDADDDFGKWKGTMPEIESYWLKIFNIYINHYDKNSKLYSKIIHSVFIEKQTYL